MATPDPPKRRWRAKDILARSRRAISAAAMLVIVILRLINIVREADDE